MRAHSPLQLGWIPLVLVAALALSGFAIDPMHGIYGPHQTPGTDPGFRQPYGGRVVHGEVVSAESAT
jgi:hypothetical protein